MNAIQSRIDWIRNHVDAKVTDPTDARRVLALAHLDEAEVHAEIAEREIDTAVSALDGPAATEPIEPGVVIREEKELQPQRITLQVEGTH